jgi:hypothetical protein
MNFKGSKKCVSQGQRGRAAEYREKYDLNQVDRQFCNKQVHNPNFKHESGVDTRLDEIANNYNTKK